MKKVGILTINDYTNYGNRLQNYATQEVLLSLGLDVETVVNATNLKDPIKSFKEFSRKYIKETNYNISVDNFPENIGLRYDYFVTGSDQVWNPSFRHFSEIDFLRFAPKHKRVAYAASFGISTIPEEHIDNFKLWISEMAYLSVRESAGASIIKDLTERDAIVLVDPTLMLSSEKWLSISKPAKCKPSKKYIATYFLGDIELEYRDIIIDIAQKKDLEIVHLIDKGNKGLLPGPEEFIDYINSSEILVTDSFHGAIFSILFEKPFIIFDRIGKLLSMNSRIETLLATFRLDERKWQQIKATKNYFEVDFAHVSPILQAERTKSVEYLKNALSIT